MAELSSFKLHAGDPAPDFSLPSVDGKKYSLRSFEAQPLLVVSFWCNHCPYVQAWEGRMIDLARRYHDRGVGFAVINSNDVVAYPGDSWDNMVRRAREHQYPFPYLWDESQEVAHAYGALVTPHPFLFDKDRHLLFQGRIDDDHSEPSRVRHKYLQEALDAALETRVIRPAEVPVLGCSVKWR